MQVASFIAYIIAITIPILAIYLIYALDLFGTGKVGTVIGCMVWGATFAFGGAWVVNNFTLTLVSRNTIYTVTAPVVEELLKALILIYFIQSPRFRYFVDGAVYGFGAGIGFAVVENILYLSSNNADLALAISRVLSASLMHATASAIVGSSLGQLRRSPRGLQRMWPLLGMVAAVLIHMVYNRIVINEQINGIVLLLIAITLGLGGSVIIGMLISQGVSMEKKRFAKTLDVSLGVSEGERKAIQQLGGSSIEQIMHDLEDSFGAENMSQIHHLLVTQANIGILRNNLASENVSPRLRAAWEAEIALLQDDVKETRKQLGKTVATYMQTIFPTNDSGLWDKINEEMAHYDPTLVHTFDMFMRVSRMAEAFTPEQLALMAERLQKIGIFKYISLADLENLSRAISVVHFNAGDMIFDKGDAGDAMYLIEQGSIQIFTQDYAGNEKHLRTFHPGEVVGDFSVLDGQPRSARARAGVALRALVLRREVFMMFLQSRPQVVLAVLQVLTEKARYTTEAVEESVRWASRIVQGDYQPVKDPLPVLNTEERSELPDELPVRIGEAFSHVAAAIHLREQSFSAQLPSA